MLWLIKMTWRLLKPEESTGDRLGGGGCGDPSASFTEEKSEDVHVTSQKMSLGRLCL